MSGRVSGQSGALLPGVSWQNGNVVPNMVAAWRLICCGWRGHEYSRSFFLLAQRHRQPIDDSQMQKLKDIVKRLEDGLFKSSHTKDEHMNLGTLESRLHSLIKRPSLNNPNLVNPNAMTAMIPTPGLSHNGSSTMIATSSVDAPMSYLSESSSMQPTNAKVGSLMSSLTPNIIYSKACALCIFLVWLSALVPGGIGCGLFTVSRVFMYVAQAQACVDPLQVSKIIGRARAFVD
ncbi:histone acetyltransferase HAC1 [Eucalyptus grandis]|uniref:histone acetyltransferase HAC1 n=1 Tax=Eucalyptus grandis TaxID=71139 RepID=UPI00192E7C29|nr:histone acetyltransferase HAC1 [Eucalyptus grandis]